MNIKIKDHADVLNRAIDPGADRVAVRRDVAFLSRVLAFRVRAMIPDAEQRGSVLCVIILRGGALVLPGFLEVLTEADFHLMALKRDDPHNPSAISCSYASPLLPKRYDTIVYVDCIAGTGNTLRYAQERVLDVCTADREITAVLCASSEAVRVANRLGIAVAGFRLEEDLVGPLVLPDLGRLDAGDLLSWGGGAD